MMKKTSMFFVALLSAFFVLSTQSVNAQIGISPIPPKQDPKEGCISAADMTEIANYFKQFKNLAGQEYCHDESQTSYLLAGLNYIRKVQFSESMVNSPDELFTGKFAKDWFGYFTKRINKIQIESNCPTGVIAFVYAGFMADSTMHACPMALTNAFTALDLASVFLHEARHLDGFPHVVCAEGPRAGLQGACDKKISDGGSYAVTVETYTQLGQYGKDIHPAFRAIAQASALIYGAEAFQQKVKINTEEAFLALTSDKKIYKIDSTLSKAPQIMGSTVDLGHFIKSKMGLVIMPTDKTKQMVRVFPTGETQSMANEYNTSIVSDRQNVVDYYFAWTWNARIEKNKVRFFCDKREKPTQSTDVSFPSQVEAQSIVYPEGYTPNQNFAYVATSQGLYKFSCESGKGQIVAAQNTIDSDIKRIHRANNVILALTKTGEVLNLSNQAQRIDLGLSNIVDITSYSRATFFDK
ncbi:MAG: hypothetical protein ACK4VO_02135 [Pseudobdellovibrio sp.]